MADLLKFVPKDRQGDPDFPGIPALAHFYKPKPIESIVIDTLSRDLPKPEQENKS